MKRFGIGLMFLLIGSLLVLILLITLRALNVTLPKIIWDQNNSTENITQVIEPTDPAQSPTPTDTPTPEPTATLPEFTDTPQPTATEELLPTPDEGCDRALFLLDVTVPDKTIFNPDTKFTKTWRLQNDGSCTWSTKYKLYFYSGDIMSGVESQPLTSVPVPPGTAIDVSIVLRAPINLGTYKGFWAIKNESGQHFGLGSLNKPFYVEIVVAGDQVPTETAP